MPNNAIANCSSIPIKKAFIAIDKKQFPKQRLLSPSNYYFNDTITKTNNLAIGNVKEGAIAQYIAASIITHCYDGWNYLSRAIESFLNGDISSSIHFTYYSELRAVMSIMACNGIGIFDKRHVYFNSLMNIELLPSGRRSQLSTHGVANDLIKAWGTDLSHFHRDNILKMIKVNNRNLYDWINAITGSQAQGHINTVLNDWLGMWSIDIKLGEDQRIRNETSYRPHFKTTKLNILDDLQDIFSIWSGLEPANSNPFNEIDKYLCRNALEQVFRMSNGQKINTKKYQEFIEHIFDNLGESKDQFLFKFLLRKENKDDHILMIEAKRDIVDKKINFKKPLPMICRSILLLRLATGSAHNVLSECNIQKGRLDFWWQAKAESIGVIDNTSTDFETIDLYSDISNAIDEIKLKMSSINSRRDAIILAGNEINDIKQFQRICFWGLGL